MKKAVLLFLLGVTAAPSAYAECEGGHWVESVSDDGDVVILEDSSVWQIESGDTPDTALWLSTTSITACEDKLINTDDSEIAHAARVR